MILPAASCPIFSRRQLKRWHAVDYRGIASQGAVGQMEGSTFLWYDPERLEAWVRDNSTTRSRTTVVPAGEIRLGTYPRNKRPTAATVG